MATAGLTHWADLLIVVLYFCAVLAVGIWTICRPNRANVKSYFLAGRDMMWIPVGASLYVSNIGSEHFIGLAGTGASSGIAIVLYEWSSVPLVILMAWLFVPVYVSSGVFTLPEFLQRRFGGSRIRIYLSALALLLYIVTKLAVSMFAGALFIQLALGWELYTSAIGLILITGVYTVLGGLTAVIYTDAIQTLVLLVGACALTAISFSRIGGISQLAELYLQSAANTSTVTVNSTLDCSRPPADSMHVLRHPLYSDNPWPGLILQSSIGCLWYWCADQVIVQRALAARSLAHAKAGGILCGYLKILPLFIMIMPGMISRILYPDTVGCVDPDICESVCGNRGGCSNIAYPKLVIELMPTGLRGLLISVMLAAIMSSLTSIFNSASALFTMDLWRRVRNKATQRELLIVGRLFTVLLCVVAVLWIPLVQSSQGGQLFIYIQTVQGYLGTPVGIVFLFAILWTRMTEKAAFCSLLIGHALGIIRFVLDFVYPAPPCGSADTRPSVVTLHYTYYCSMVVLITAVLIVVISLVTKPDTSRLEGTTFWTRFDLKEREEVEMNDATDIKPIDGVIEEKAEKQANTDGETDTGGHTDRQTDTDGHTDGQTGGQTDTLRGRCLNILCGAEQMTHVDHVTTRLDWLKQSDVIKHVLNVNAVAALAITVALVGVFH